MNIPPRTPYEEALMGLSEEFNGRLKLLRSEADEAAKKKHLREAKIQALITARSAISEQFASERRTAHEGGET